MNDLEYYVKHKIAELISIQYDEGVNTYRQDCYQTLEGFYAIPLSQADEVHNGIALAGEVNAKRIDITYQEWYSFTQQ